MKGLNSYVSCCSLFSTFQSPFAETPCRPQDIDFFVPAEYLTNLHIRERLAPIKLSKYGEDTLFYLFYTNINDVLQLAAAAELLVFTCWLLIQSLYITSTVISSSNEDRFFCINEKLRNTYRVTKICHQRSIGLIG